MRAPDPESPDTPDTFRAASTQYREAVSVEAKEHSFAARVGARGLQARLAAATDQVAALSGRLRAVEGLLSRADFEGQHHIPVEAVRAALKGPADV